MSNVREITINGLWKNNPGMVQLLGLCPLLAVSNTVINALGLALATAFVLTATNIIVSMIRGVVRPEVRIPVFVMVIAATVTAVELIMQAQVYELYLILGIFIPLITTNCIIIGRAEAFASKNPVWAAALDGIMMSLGFALILLVLGALREVLGQGTLLADAHLMFGEVARDWTLIVLPGYRGLLLAALPPGAFLGLGLLIALKNSIDLRRAARAQAVGKLQTA